PGQRFKKMTRPLGFEEAEADWLSGVLANVRVFSDSLSDLLRRTGFRYVWSSGRPHHPREEAPSETEKPKRTNNHPDSAIEAIALFAPELAKILESPAPLENFEILGKKDLEKDEPKGWLLAKTITV